MPGKIFHIPLFILDLIEEIHVKPFMFIKNFSFKSKVINFVQMQKHIFEDDETLVKIVNFEIEKNFTEKPPYLNNIDIGISKEYNYSENDNKDSSVKRRINIINDYISFKGSEFQAKYSARLKNMLSDILFVFTPILRIRNCIPRTIKLEKSLPSALLNQNRKNRGYEKIGQNYHDIECDSLKSQHKKV